MLRQNVSASHNIPYQFKVYSDSDSCGKILQVGSDFITPTVREVIVKKYPLKYG